VGEQAREAVLRAAAELSYVTNRAARSLMTRRSDSIAFVVAESEDRFFADPYFAAVLRGAHAAVAAHDVQLVFAVLSDDAERERFERFARGGHLDGVVFVSLHGDDPLPQRLQQAGVPVILSGRPFANDEPPVTYVDADNRGGARSAVRFLAERGRTRLATITGPLDMSASVDRHEGFLAEAGRRAMHALLDAAPDVDGVFAANDLMALGAMQAATERGRRVPEDVAVIGFDDIALAAAATPPLTTVRQPMMDMGHALAARLLHYADTGEPPDPLVLPTEIVVRGTV
jgi:DNA-binding LacI/PurR family transcriptional regulator